MATPRPAQASAAQTRGRRMADGVLTRERIVAAALAVIDARGLAALSMRELGRALGSSTMAVYRHFTDKTALLDAIIDHVVEGFEPAGLDGDWMVRARGMCLRVRAAMLAHPELADLIGREFRRSPTSLRVNAHMIEALESSGVPRAALASTYWATSSYTTGYSLLEAQVLRRGRGAAGESTPASREQKLAAMMESVEGLSAEALALAPQVLAQPLDDRQFLFGLDCLLAGLSEVVARTHQSAPQSEA